MESVTDKHQKKKKKKKKKRRRDKTEEARNVGINEAENKTNEQSTF